MKPKKEQKTLEIFKVRLTEIINPTHPLVKLAETINWKNLEEQLAHRYSEKMGAPGKEIRLMAGLQYLKYMYNESDEMIVQKFVENPYYQYFCGNEYFEQVNVDTTVQEKAISYPTDAKLYYKMLKALVAEAKERGIALRQSYKFVAKQALTKQAGYAHARQMNRSRKMTKKLKTYLGRVYREIVRHQAEQKDQPADVQLLNKLAMAEKLLTQSKESKQKLYSIHAPEVECISKGKAHKRYVRRGGSAVKSAW